MIPMPTIQIRDEDCGLTLNKGDAIRNGVIQILGSPVSVKTCPRLPRRSHAGRLPRSSG